MITIENIRNPARKSGFDHVNTHEPGGQGRGNRKASWRAACGWDGSNAKWRGPTRYTQQDAAQDYCDYINFGKTMPSTPKAPSKTAPLMLNQAGHARPRTSTSVNPIKASVTDKARLDKRPYVGNMQGFLYLIGESDNESVVKVGWSRRENFARLSELQTGNSRLLLGLAEKPGTLKDEYKLHVAYEPDNVLQEWFEVSPELLSEFDLTEDEFALTIQTHGKVVTL